MRTTKIIIKNLFGIKEATLDGRSVELSGPKGAGKTSVLDAIRFALTNKSDRDYVIHQGAEEGEILIETDTGLQIDRKARSEKGSVVKVRDGSMVQTRPAEFLAQIFTPLQLDPVKFTQLSRQEKNREILSLIEFPWDMNWISEQFRRSRPGWTTPSIFFRCSTTSRPRTGTLSEPPGPEPGYPQQAGLYRGYRQGYSAQLRFRPLERLPDGGAVPGAGAAPERKRQD